MPRLQPKNLFNTSATPEAQAERLQEIKDELKIEGDKFFARYEKDDLKHNNSNVQSLSNRMP